VDGDNVVLKAEKKALADFRKTASMCPANTNEDKRNFVLLGGGTYLHVYM
jgi:hypothetical protein